MFCSYAPPIRQRMNNVLQTKKILYKLHLLLDFYEIFLGKLLIRLTVIIIALLVYILQSPL